MTTLTRAALCAAVLMLAACDQMDPAANGSASGAPETTGAPAETASTAPPTETPAGGEAELTSDAARVSYVIGYDAAQQMMKQGVELDVAGYTLGLEDAVDERSPRLSQAQAEAAMQALQERLMAEAQAKQAADSEANLRSSEQFLAENAGKEGVTVTESGLQYEVVSEGSGPKPTEDSRVRVHYEGRLVNGRVFDSSIERGEPVDFGVTEVIPGWTEALQLMPEGSKWKLYIPPNLGYGENAPPAIGPNQALIFDVELLQANLAETEEQ